MASKSFFHDLSSQLKERDCEIRYAFLGGHDISLHYGLHHFFRDASKLCVFQINNLEHFSQDSIQRVTFGRWIEEKAETLGVHEAPGAKKEGLNLQFCPRLAPRALKPSGDTEADPSRKAS